MSEAQLQAFLEAVATDATMQGKLAAAADADAAVAIAKEAGFSVTADELRKLNQEKELTDQELENVSGGTIFGGSNRCVMSHFAKWCQ